jgi:hypothetical protein
MKQTSSNAPISSKLENELFLSCRGFSDKSKKPKVLHQKLVCYVSAFDLNISDWFTEFENIEVFKTNLHKELGK